MAFRASCVALLLSILPIAGCGTAANLVRWRPEEGGRSPFGGVRQDVSCIEQASNGESDSRTSHKALICAADLPLSFVGDVVTWPYTAAYTFINQPIPTPPVTPGQAIPTSAELQPPDDVRPEPYPLQTLPEPRKLP
jgi:hypothetical protein